VNPTRLHRLARRLTLLAVLAGGFYLWQRFEVISLPEAGRSPLLRITPGNQLWLDRRPGEIGVGDVLFYEQPDGSIGFAEVEVVDPDADRYWLSTDAPGVPAVDSDELGWIPRESIQARLMMATDF